MEANQQLIDDLTRLCRNRRLPLQGLDVDAEVLTSLGFVLEADEVVCPADLEWLDAARIRAALSQSALNWLRELSVLAVVGSTSSLLQQRAAKESVDGVVVTAELQIAGRGRRGRLWMSPLGQNLAVSAGLMIPRPPAGMGGFSLAMGLAVLDCLHRVGACDVALKWPNDVLWQGRKLAGILIDLNLHPAGSEVILGVGLNLHLPQATLADIDQPAADLVSAGVSESRNRLVGELISCVVDYARGFAEHGFEPMREAFDQHHAFHGQECVLLQGEKRISGVVAGVGRDGELLLRTDSGVTAFTAGEVSLRRPG